MPEVQIPASPAPAQPAERAVVSAAHAAITSNDTGAYREARRAERAGKPLPEVDLAAPADAPIADATAPVAPAQPALSRREREQQATNERIRIATEKAVADAIRDKDAEIARLRAQTPAPRPEAAPAQPEAPKVETLKDRAKRLAAMPDAPKLSEYDTVEEHAAAMAMFDRETALNESTRRDQFDAHRARFEKQSSDYGERLRKSAEADPEFLTKIPTELHDAKPLSALQKGEPIRLANLITEVGFNYSEDPGRLYRHFKEHPEAADAIVALPPERMIPALLALDGRLSGVPAKPVAPKPPTKTLSDAPDVQTLGSRAAEATDPKSGAIKRGDTRAYREIRRQERAAGRR